MKLVLLAGFLTVTFFVSGQSKEAFINATYQHFVRGTNEPYVLTPDCVPIFFRRPFSYEIRDLQKEVWGKVDKSIVTELIEKALKDTLPLKWNEKMLLNAKLLPEKQARKTKSKIYYFSRPVFSANRLYALVRMEYHCAGPCSKSCNYIFKRSGASWIRIHEFGCWGR